MLILPLPARPDWSRPPLVTLLIMFLCLVAFFMQGSDQQRSAAAWRFYEQSGLAKLEMRAYQAELAARQAADPLTTQHKQPAVSTPHATYQAMTADRPFMQRLRANLVIKPEHPDFPLWRSQRTHFEKLRQRIVTENYALNAQEPRLASLFTHMFLHADIMHLSGNMAVLFVVGYTVEAALGPLAFLALYLLGGLAAAVPDLMLPAGPYRLSLGASGAISAIMAAYLVLFGKRRINFFYWLFFFFGTVRWPALVILPVWLANELLQRFVLDRGGNVNYLAHFAGLLGGALLVGAYLWRQGGRRPELIERQDAEQAVEAIRQQAETLVAKMQFGPAALLYRKLCREHRPGDTQLAADYLRIARLARQADLLTDAHRHLLRTAAEQPKSIAPALLAEALEGGPGTLPRLLPTQWEGLVARLIDGRELEAAERLFIRLFSHADTRPAMSRQANRLAEAFIHAGQDARAAPIRRLLAGAKT